MGRPAFTQRDVEKAVAGAIKAGFAVGGIQIDRRTGAITILPPGAIPAQPAAVNVEAEDLDAELQAWREAHGDG